jgi:hypothetical protein
MLVRVKCTAQTFAEFSLSEGVKPVHRVTNGIKDSYRYKGVEIDHLTDTLTFIYESDEHGDDVTRFPMIDERLEDL